MLVLVGGEKGGVGKTTLTLNLAAMRARAGKDVLLVDGDKQASANLWAGIRREAKVEPTIACVQKTGKTLGAEVNELAERYTDVIIDAGGRDSVELRAALTVVRLAVFPLQASLFDAATLETLSQLVEMAQGFNPELVAGVLLNRTSTNPQVREADEARELIATYPNLHLMQSLIRDRIIYRKSVRDGLSVIEYKPHDELADAEMQSLYEEVFGNG
jgi:chromosome partitioning protein